MHGAGSVLLQYNCEPRVTYGMARTVFGQDHAIQHANCMAPVRMLPVSQFEVGYAVDTLAGLWN